MIDGLKPYPEYKQSGSQWIGAIPAHWGSRALRTVVTRKNQRGRPDLPLLSVLREKGVIRRSRTGNDENRNYIPDDLSNYKVVSTGNLVINKMKAWQGSMGIAPCEGVVSPAYFVFEFHLPNKAFGHALLRSKPYVAHFAQASDGVRVGQWDLSIAGMRSIPVIIPDADEQAAIVRFLDHATRRLNRAILAKQKVIALLNEQKQVIIHRSVTRGIEPGVPLKPSGIPWLGDIPRHWDLLPLKSLCLIQSGVTLGKYYIGQDLTEYPYLRVANVQAGHLDLGVLKTLRLPAAEATRSLLEIGDVLMTEGGDPDKLGRGCVWEGEVSPCLHQNHIFAVRPDVTKLFPKYLSAVLISDYAKNYFLLTAKQTTNLASTNKTTIGRFRIPLPKLSEQNSILSGLEKDTSPVTQAIVRNERQIRLLQEYSTRLIADVVTGKLDVREAARRIPDETEADDFLDEKVELSSGYDDFDSSGLTEREELDEIDSNLLGYGTGANQ